MKDWQVVLTVDETAVSSHTRSIRAIYKKEASVQLVCLCMMLLCVYLRFKTANNEVRKVNQELNENNKLLQMVVDLSDHIIFVYDMRSRSVEMKTNVKNPIFRGPMISSVPESILEKNAIAPSSRQSLKQLFESIESEKTATADIQLAAHLQEKVWYRISLHNLYDETGKVTRTVGVAEDISMLKKGEAAIRRKEEIHKMLVANALTYARVDLEADSVLEVNGKEVCIPYGEYLQDQIVARVCEEHQAYIAQKLSMESLQKAFAQGQYVAEVQCMMQVEQQNKWVSCLAYRVHTADGCKVTFVITNIDRRKRKELALKKQAERDGLTCLYNAATVRAKIDEVLSSMHSNEENQIFILLDLDNFKQINDTFGHAYGDYVLQEVADELSRHFRASDILGRIGGDEFAIMLCNVTSDKFVENLKAELGGWLTKTYTQSGQSVRVSASIGVCVAPHDGTTFGELYRKADVELYRDKRRNKHSEAEC